MNIIKFTTVADLREKILNSSLDQYVFVQLDNREIELDEHTEHRFIQVATEIDSTLTYSFYRERNEDGTLLNHPVIDYQPGSVRNDFDFGPLVMLNVADVLNATEDFTAEDSAMLDGGWYALRLHITLGRMMAMIPEYLYTAKRVDYRKSGEKQHDYVNPSKREYQKQMEEVLTAHLRMIGGLLPPASTDVNYDEQEFPVEASVIIPVRNRVKTVGDALHSALNQKCSFPFNVIVVDNDSTDGTRQLLEACEDEKLHLIKVSDIEQLGIGGCWNRAIMSDKCGRFAVQLDSDDLYNSENVLQIIVDKFRSGNYGMVIGSYMMVDFNGNPIPPGLISHDEWTDENGHNNAFRIHGFGAPRAFFTPLVREFLFPNVSYGEDYAMVLRISREYRIGRIYDPLYLCRRWDGNSDAALSVEKTNQHNSYKDCLRSIELLARVRANHSNREPIMMDATELMGGAFDEFLRRHQGGEESHSNQELYDLQDVDDFEDIDDIDDLDDLEDYEDNDDLPY